MSKVLVITNSLNGEASVTNALVGETLQRLRPEKVVYRDLSANPLPHLGPQTVGAILKAEPKTDAEKAARALSDELIADVNGADVIVIGAPMYNFGMPTTLKAWFDHVMRAGVTFRYGPDGTPEGLVKGKRAIVLQASAGAYGDKGADAGDFLVPYLKFLLAFIGVTDVTVAKAEGLVMGEEAKAASLAAASKTIAAFASDAVQPLAA